MISLDRIYQAAFVLKDIARKTDLIAAPRLLEDGNLYLKTENLQITGSFKVRGAYYKISRLSEEEKKMYEHLKERGEKAGFGFSEFQNRKRN
jgi:threonine dehydratase